MDLHDGTGTQARFRAYTAALTPMLGHADRIKPFEHYCVGLLSAEGRKSVEPLAAVTAPERTAAQHQSLLHVVAQAPWSDAAVLTRVREQVLPSITREEPIQAWIIDDTSFPKKGDHSVGVARQYCGQLGKLANCQVAVSLSVATHQGSLPIAYRLYLPQDWIDDPVRRSKAGIPEEVTFQTKPEMASQQMRQALADGVPPAVVLMDPAYGGDGKLRGGISELGLSYVAGILPTTTVWRPGEAPLPPMPWSRRGRRPTRLRRDATHQPVSVKALAFELPADTWQQITWRDGSNTALTSRFARLPVRPAHDDARRSEPAPEEWLLIEWPDGEAEPDHYWFSTLPADISLERMVDLTKLPLAFARAWLADRARLPRSQAGGWAGPLRRTWLAWLPPSRNALHCGLRIPDLREGDDPPPLRTDPRLARRAICPSRRLPTPRFCRCAHSATCRTQSRHCASASRGPCFTPCPMSSLRQNASEAGRTG